MFSNVVVIHRRGSSDRTPLFTGPNAVSVQPVAGCFFWKTCLRQIAIGDESLFEATERHEEDEIYQGDDAYRFILQVICGLHSPLLGETEVYGQFKNAVASFLVPATPFGTQLKKFFRVLFEDAKAVRQAHLVDLGSQSYGSVLRRESKNLRRIHLLGAGHLVQEMLPWVAKDHTEIHVHARDLAKAQKSLEAFTGLQFHDLEKRRELSNAEVIVIAAPVTAEWISQWIPADANPVLVIDLREDSAEDKIQGFHRVLDLPEVFARISANQELLQKRKVDALAAVDRAVRERASHVEYRPFGWEDVCA